MPILIKIDRHGFLKAFGACGLLPGMAWAVSGHGPLNLTESPLAIIAVMVFVFGVHRDGAGRGAAPFFSI